MNNQATLEKMRSLKLRGMSRAFEASLEAGAKENYTADEMLAYLVDAEWDDRHNRKLARLLKSAKFRYQASLEQLDYNPKNKKRKLDKNLMLRFSGCDWIQKAQDVIVTGPTGAGKSFIASALGHQACILGYKVLYCNCTKFFPRLKYSEADGSYARELEKIQRTDLLILDDFGLYPFDTQSRLALLEIMEDRHGQSSTLIASQFPVKSWFELIGNPTIADAVCDRIVHGSHRINLEESDSLRKRED